MYIAHYLLPFFVIFIYLYFIRKDKIIINNRFNFDFMRIKKGKIILTFAGIIFFGLMLGNLIDIDHVYYRLSGDVPWLKSYCGGTFNLKCSSLNYYPLHNMYFFIVFFILSFLVFFKDNRIRLYGWIFIGATIHLILDYIQYITGIVI